MSTHLVRSDLIPTFLKTIAPIARKCHKKNIPYDYRELGKQFKEIEENGKKKYIEYTEFEIDCNPCFNGWDVIVQIEQSDSGKNIITRCNVPYSKEYDKYIDSEIFCEHCKQHRRRKLAYILKNKETQKTIIVGSTCLEEFTGGLDASIVAKCFESLNAIGSLVSSGSDTSSVPLTSILFSTEYVLSIALSIVRAQGGYKKNSEISSTTSYVKTFLDGSSSCVNEIDAESEVLAHEYLSWIRTYVNEKEELSLYERNVKTVCNSDKISWSEIAILCSIIPVYQRNHKQNTEEVKINEYYGEQKQRITIDVKNIKTHSFDSLYGTFYIHVITSEEGYTFVWKTNKNIIKPAVVFYKNNEPETAIYIPNKIKGTVSNFEEYNGIKQTVLKRCEVCSFILKNNNTNNIIDETSEEIAEISYSF